MGQILKFSSIAIKSALIGLVRPGAGKKFLFDSIAKMPGITAKASQLLSLKIADGDQLAPIEPMSIGEVVGIITQTNTELATQIVTIDDEAKTASIGQVHKVVLKDGRECAVKVQYPNICTEVLEQLDLLLKAMALSPARNFGIDVNAYRDFLSRELARELDYRCELENQTNYYDKFKDQQDRFYIPKPDISLSATTVLVQEFVSAQALVTLKGESENVRSEVANLLFELLIQSIFVKNIIQVDPHAANFAYDLEKRRLVVFDFGAILSLTSEQVNKFSYLIQAVVEGRSFSPFDLFCDLGFEPTKLDHVATRLPIILEKLFAPLKTAFAWSPNEWQLNSEFKKILAEDSWWFRTAGPPWFLYLMRSVYGVLQIIDDLDVKIQPQNFYNEFIRSIDTSAVQIRDYSQYLTKPPVLSTDCAKHLKVKVTEGA